MIRNSEEVEFVLNFAEWRGFQDMKVIIEGLFQVHRKDGAGDSKWFSIISI